MATDEQQINDQMRRAADFVLKHQHALLHALVGQAHTLDGDADMLRGIAGKGGNNLVTAQAAAETATRKEAEATKMRAAQAALAQVFDPSSSPPEPDEQGGTVQKPGRYAR